MAETLAAPPRLERPLPPCPECGAPVAGAFCGACGQKAEALRQPVHHFLRDSFVEFFGLDGRVWRTFSALMVRPGALTVAYVGGQRQRYLRPLRVYLTSTLLFFFVLSLLDPAGAIRDSAETDAAADTVVAAGARLAEIDRALDAPQTADERRAEALNARIRASRAAFSRDSLRLANGPPGALATRAAADKRETDAAFIALGTLKSDGVEIGSSTSRIERRRLGVERAILAALPPDSLIHTAPVTRAAALVLPDTLNLEVSGVLAHSDLVVRFRQAPDETARMQVVSEGVAAAIGRVPAVMFLLLPVFAFGLKLLYVRRGWFFAEHLVFGLHTHAAAFVAFTGLAVVIYLGATDRFGADTMVTVWVALGLVLTIPLYVVLAMKRVYGQGWIKTLLKAAALGSVYSVIFFLGLVAAVALAAVLG